MKSIGTMFTGKSLDRKRVLAGIVVLVLVSALFVGTMSCIPGGGNGANGSGARIQFANEIIDLGTAAPGDELEAIFVFRNTGDETLVIGEIDTKSVTEGC